jgi:CPA1 family monovalent cation:H+ antiporter
VCSSDLKVPLHSTAIVGVNLLLPFVAYQFAESLHVSGVLAVVTMGILIATRVHKDKSYSDITKMQSRSVWNTLIYLLSGLIFILIGLEFPQVLDNIPASSVIPLLMSAFAIFFIALAVRILIVFCHKLKLDRIITIIISEKYQRKIVEKHNKVQITEPFNWKDALVISWSGMRGIVSVATAIALPVTFANGQAFHQRNSIIFLTVLVVILMMLIQGLGLPLLIKWLKIEEVEEACITIEEEPHYEVPLKS